MDLTLPKKNLLTIRGTDNKVQYLDLDTGNIVPEYTPTLLKGGFTNEVADLICDHVRSGDSLKDILHELNVPNSMFYAWLSIYPEFKVQYTEARKQRADYHYHRAVEIAESAIGASKDLIPGYKLAVDTHKWGAEKLNADVYNKTKTEGNQGPASINIVLKTGVLDIESKPDIIVDEFGNFQGFSNGTDTVRMGVDREEWGNEAGISADSAERPRERFAEYEPTYRETKEESEQEG